VIPSLTRGSRCPRWSTWPRARPLIAAGRRLARVTGDAALLVPPGDPRSCPAALAAASTTSPRGRSSRRAAWRGCASGSLARGGRRRPSAVPEGDQRGARLLTSISTNFLLIQATGCSTLAAAPGGTPSRPTAGWPASWRRPRPEGASPGRRHVRRYARGRRGRVNRGSRRPVRGQRRGLPIPDGAFDAIIARRSSSTSRTTPPPWRRSPGASPGGTSRSPCRLAAGTICWALSSELHEVRGPRADLHPRGAHRQADRGRPDAPAGTHAHGPALRLLVAQLRGSRPRRHASRRAGAHRLLVW